LSSAVGYGQWAGARRLVGRGAKTQLWHEAALGLMEVIARRIKAAPSLRGRARQARSLSSVIGKRRMRFPVA